MPARTVTISSSDSGYSLCSTLQRAMHLLRSNSVEVLAGAQNVGQGETDTATILLAYLDDKPRAVQILVRGGISVDG